MPYLYVSQGPNDSTNRKSTFLPTLEGLVALVENWNQADLGDEEWTPFGLCSHWLMPGCLQTDMRTWVACHVVNADGCHDRFEYYMVLSHDKLHKKTAESLLDQVYPDRFKAEEDNEEDEE